LKKVGHFPDAAIKAGILRSILLCPTKVNSLKYCLGAIGEVGDSGIDNVVGFERRMRAAIEMRKQSSSPGSQPTLPVLGGDLTNINGAQKTKVTTREEQPRRNEDPIANRVQR